VFRWTGAALRVIVVGVLLAVVAVACAGSPASADPVAPCGASTLATLTAVDTKIANNIDGASWPAARRRSTSDTSPGRRICSARSRRQPRATQKAVSRIVYHHFWHIVRLRALDTAGRVLADVGGPYVIAPVRGVLSSADA